MVSEQPTRTMVRTFRKAGWSPALVQPKGSHTKWLCPSLTHSFILPDGHRTISPGVVAKANAALKNDTCKEGD